MDFSVEQKAIPLYVCAANQPPKLYWNTLFSPTFDKKEYEQEIKQYTLPRHSKFRNNRKEKVVFHDLWNKTTKRV
jgi:hypothetical protein